LVAKWLKLGIGAIGAAIDARKMRTAARGGLKREGEIDTQREGEGERHTERRREPERGRRRKRDTDRETDVTALLTKKGELRKICDRGHRGQELSKNSSRGRQDFKITRSAQSDRSVGEKYVKRSLNGPAC
jgi:hypothetical protein